MQKSVKKNYKKIFNIFSKNSITPTLLIVYLGMIVFFTLLNPLFLSGKNIIGILSNLSIFGIMAVGLTFVMLTGNFDISIGSITGFAVIMTAKLFNLPGVSIPIPLIIIIVILIGTVIGAINGFFVTVVGLNSIITTLGTLAIFRGLCYVYGLEPLTINNQVFTFLGRGYVLNNIPITFFYMTVIFIIGYLVLRFTVFGRKTYLVGASLESAIISGIQYKKIQFITFMISGATAAISGILLTSQLNYAQGEFGLGYEFKILTICVLGGISLMGGRGTLVGVFVATFIIGSIANGLALIGMPLNWREAIHGGILIMAILIDSFRLRRRELLRE